MFNRAIFENSRPDGVAVLEIVDGKERGEGAPRLFVPLKRTELRGEVIGPLASLRLTHVYGYTREQCDRALEALYRFPLPGDAAVTGVQVRFGEVEVRAELRERQQAEAEYEKAKQEGRQAALATRESPDVFTLHLAGLQPDQEITVETAYVQLARAEEEGWSLRIPLTTSPRYVRSDEITGRHPHGQPLALLRDPGHRFTLDLMVAGAGVVESNTHALVVHPLQRAVTPADERTLQPAQAGFAEAAATSSCQSEAYLRVRLRDGEVLPDRDCVLRWRPAQAVARPSLQVWLHPDAAADQTYFLALVAPPKREARPAPMPPLPPNIGGSKEGPWPREIILLVDHSGSMEGAKWQAADWAVKQFLNGLTPADSFALGLFHNTTRWYARAPVQATTDAVQKAISFLEKHRDSGGTELGVALEQALDLPPAAGERARHVLIVTDAEVTDTGRLLRLADSAMQADLPRRISLLCIDAAPNAFLVHQLAERGGGVARFLTSAPDEEDITTALDEVLADWAAPVLVGLRLEANRKVQAAGRLVVDNVEDPRQGTVDLGDLPAGRAVWVVGRVAGGDTTGLTFRLSSKDSNEVAVWQAGAAPSPRPAIKALFGAHRILALEFLIQGGYTGVELREQLARLGYDPEVVLALPSGTRPKIYAENVREETERALRDLLVREALDYGLASAETAFVATRTEAGRPVEGTVLVANALPTGWSEEFLTLGMPAPAAARGVRMAFGGPAVRSMSFAPQMVADRPLQRIAEALDVPAFLRRPPTDRPLQRTEPEAQAGAGKSAVLFSGIPQFVGDVAVLYDSARPADAAQLPKAVIITRVEVKFPAGASTETYATPPPESLDPGLALLIFVDDLSAPRARVRLADIVRQGGSRPLNLRRAAGQVVRVVLADPAGAWSQIPVRGRQAAPAIEVILGW